jgi:hypothetical protein
LTSEDGDGAGRPPTRTQLTLQSMRVAEPAE